MSPSGLVDTSEQWFTFTVFFQNTGNAAAENIYILDTLDQNLDATTFTFLSSSHDVVTQLLPGNVLRFNYHDIFLADSTTDEPASHGYVQYKVKRKQAVTVGATISNTAYIYFDLNAAVATNQTTAEFISITTVSGISKPAFELFPNPVREKLSVISYPLNGKKITAEILTVLGEKIYSLQSTNPSITIDVSNFPQGIYFLKVTNDNGVSVKRFVKG
jgi:uncharacterized repeat protein (TIGR01451 family)